jgi:potassium/hydrogen antiporter
MDVLYLMILVGAALFLAAIFTSLLAFRFGAPLLLVFLVVGLAAGEDGAGIVFDNAELAFFVGSIALAIILFDSGFGTRMAALRQAAAPAAVLATLGVVLTAVLTGLAARAFFGLSWTEALLLGAIVSSTDAAAVFFLLRVGGIHIRDRVRSTLEIESGANDPMAIFLTIALVELVAAGAGLEDLTGAAGLAFVQQMGLGLVMGVLGGAAIAWVVNRIEMEAPLYPLTVLAAAITLFGFTGLVGGSGFLAAYIAGLYAGNQRLRQLTVMRRFQEGMTWLAQIAMFLVLGLLATPSTFPAVALPAIATALFLILVARPLAAWLCIRPFGYEPNETAFVSWVGLRGAVSILLGILPLLYGLPNGHLLFNTAFIIVLTSLLVQGWTVRPMARRLRLIAPPDIGPLEKVELELPGSAHHELAVYRAVPDSPVARGVRLPRWARPSLVIREGHSMPYQQAGRIRAGDRLYIFAAPRYVKLLDRLFASPVEVSEEDRDFFGSFAIAPDQPVGELAQAYGLKLGRIDPSLPIGRFMVERLGGTAEAGDRVTLDKVELVVRAVDEDGAVSAVGLVLEPHVPPPARWTLMRTLYDVARTVRARLLGR